MHQEKKNIVYKSGGVTGNDGLDLSHNVNSIDDTMFPSEDFFWKSQDEVI